MNKKNFIECLSILKTLFLSALAAAMFLTFSCSNSADKLNSPGTSDTQKIVKQDTVIDKMPEFPGGEAAMTKFIIDNVRYPEAAKKSGSQAKVLVDFLVTKTGKLDSIRVKEKTNELLDKEAIRVISSMPDWIPGMDKGVAIDVQMTLPISFKLQ
ncbi:MAG TPA: energy transducer TonB [Bacteroidales bacterium]|nr:energy transducer TonB [Bacteroidales bacterium]